jgi:cytochrome P450
MVQWCAPALENLMGLARDHGDVVALPQFGVPFYLFNHPEQIEEALRSKPDRFKKASLLTALRPLLGDGLFTSEGEVWRQHRIAAQPLFCTKKIQHYASVVVDSANRLLDRWQVGETRDFHADMMRLALEIVMRTLFDADATDVVPLGEELEAATNYYTDPRSVWSNNGECASPADGHTGHDATRLNTFISAMIEKRRSSGVAERGDLLSRLLLMQGPNGSPLSDAALRDQMVTYFIAGQETTALALSYTFALLCEHPEAATALSAELDRVLGGRLPMQADVAQLPFANAVIKESLRLFPPVWATGREALDDCEIGGHHIPRGAQLLMSQFIVHRDPRFWCDPEQFDPSRWMLAATKNRPRCAYFPFGDGPRICIGAQLATLEAVLLVATIAQRYRLEFVEKQPLCLVPALTLRPRDGLRMLVQPRASAVEGCVSRA